MTAAQPDTHSNPTPAERLIVALDVETAAKARDVISELDGLASTFKIGMQLFGAAGPNFVDEIASAGNKVFLDLKFHDIPNTAAKAGVEAARLGVWMFNVHAAGGSEMMKAVRTEVSDFCISGNRPRPIIIGVTVLTSSDVGTLREIGSDPDVEAQVERLSRLTAASGLDGVVASANEIQMVRRSVGSPRFLIVTPGIRPLNATKGDQKRVMSPGAAILAGADHLVVGRPILEAADRAEAARKILDEIGEVI